MKRLIYLIFFLAIHSTCYGQYAELRGTIVDDQNTPFPDLTVLLFQGENVANVSATDENGQYMMSSIVPGMYSLRVEAPGYSKYQQNIRFFVGKTEIRNINLRSSNDTLPDIIVYGESIESENVSGEIEKERLDKGTGTTVGDIVKGNPKIRSINGQYAVGPNRPTGTGILVNNNRLIGPSPITVDGMQAISVIDNGVLARYGGFSGGAIRYTPSLVGLDDVNAIRFQTSSAFNKYHFNQLTYQWSRALKIDYGNVENRAFVKWGTSLLAVYDYKKDPRPLYNGTWRVKESSMQKLRENPLTSSELVGAKVSSASFLTEDDLERVQARDNASRHNASGQFQIYHQPNWRSRIQWINRYQYLKQRLTSTPNQLLNSENNPEQVNHFIHSQLLYNNRIKTPYDRYGESLRNQEDVISRMSYSLELDFQQNVSTVQHLQHRDNFFNYGHVGRFETLKSPIYNYVENSKLVYNSETDSFVNLRGFWEYGGYTDTSVHFTPGSLNSERANYTRSILQSVGSFENIGRIQEAGGVVNGFNIPNIYSLYFDQGSITGGFGKSHNTQLSVNAYTELAIHPFKNKKLQHDVEFGVSFRKENRSYYNLSANNLWRLMPLLVNDHIRHDDPTKAYLSQDQNGKFTDTLFYHTSVDLDAQKVFDERLRDRLIAQGRATESSFIDINNLNPEDFKISDFSADELLNNGSPYVSYAGYDHTGKRRNGRSGISNFLNNPLDRNIDAYSPVEMAAWIQDKFVFKDLIVRAGLRLERFDANQPVLKDPYLLHPAHTVGEVQEIQGFAVDHPDHIGSDYVVYVNDAKAPSAVTGYRNGNNWYDANGLEISDPSIIANKSSGGTIQPYLINPENRDISAAAFEDYTTQILALPRINFSFPLNSYTLFYFYYDKLAQYPSQRQLFAPYSDYFEMELASGKVFANPAMKPRVKTEYQLGYKQFIGKKSTIDISASYAFVKNDFNQFRMEYAYPYAYTTYSNVDFSTTKRLIATYELRGDNLYMNVSYGLQFSEGTGSNVNSAASLLQVGQPNLRSLYPMDFDQRHSVKGNLTYQFGSGSKMDEYKGPYIGKNQILKNAFISVGFQALSGTPFTKILQAVPTAQSSLGVATRSQTSGNPQGSRLPWQFNTDLRFEKAFKMTDAGQSLNLYVMVSNLLNNRIVNSVYSYTGLPEDDGYLNSPAGRQQIVNQLDAHTFSMLYEMRMSENFNLASGTNVQIGCRLNF